jgi:hypothetical protein
MKAKFYVEAGQPKVLINGEWNALSLFLETDSSFEDARKHVELKKTRDWMGNTSLLKLVSGSVFEVSTPLEIDLNAVQVYRKQLLILIDEWAKFKKNREPNVVNV